MRVRSVVCVVGGLGLVVGCGRTSMDFGGDDIGSGLDAGDEILDGPGFDDGFDPEYEPEVDPPLPESCGDGIAEPGELCFMPQITFWSRIDPCAIDIGDIDGDGHLDVATPNSDFEHVESSLNLTSVLYGNGLGQLSEPVAYVSGDDIPVGIRLGDLNADGGLDMVVVNSDAGSLSVMLNFGEQQMGDAGRIVAGSNPTISDVGDINGDGILDVAVTALDEIRIALGRGDGNFEPSGSIALPGTLWSVRLLDVNADGAMDMLASNTTDATIHVWLGDGQGQLIEYDRLQMTGMPLGIADADIDFDGHLDLLIAHSFGMAVLLGNGAGDFNLVEQIDAGLDPRDIAIADYDNDGWLDAAIVNSSSQDITLVTGRGEGQFVYRATYAVGTLPSGIEAGDFNSDSVPDLAVSNQLSNNIGLILSNP